MDIVLLILSSLMFGLFVYLFFAHRKDLEELKAFNKEFTSLEKIAFDEMLLYPKKEQMIKDRIMDFKDHLRRLRL